MSRRDSNDRTGDKHLWRVPVAVDKIPETGRQMEISADTDVRAAVAKIAGVEAVHHLAAVFDLTRHGHDGVRVDGKVFGTVEQHCVVTLDPIQTSVEEAFDLVFASRGQIEASAEHSRASAPPEVLQDGIVDLGAVAIEFLLLGIDPYPRKPGAIFAAPLEPEIGANRPFAALAALKKSGGGSDG